MTFEATGSARVDADRLAEGRAQLQAAAFLFGEGVEVFAEVLGAQGCAVAGVVAGVLGLGHRPDPAGRRAWGGGLGRDHLQAFGDGVEVAFQGFDARGGDGQGLAQPGVVGREFAKVAALGSDGTDDQRLASSETSCQASSPGRASSWSSS